MAHSLLRNIGTVCFVFFALSAQAATPPPLSNPDVSPEAPLGAEHYGALSGRAAVSAGGNAAYSIPLELPPGRKGLVPDLSLSYNSNMQNSIVGLGWFLQGASSISRCPKTLSQDNESRPVRYDTDDAYCLDGHKLVAVSGAYGAHGTVYRTEVDQFKSIQSWTESGVPGGPASFEVRTKSGLRLLYGTSADSRVEGQGSGVVRIWALHQVEDASQNYYRYSYFENTALGQHYITKIEYNPVPVVGGGGQITWQAPDTEVNFLYEARPDTPTHYEAGSPYQPTPQRIAQIQTRVDGYLVLDYQLTYETVGADDRSRLIRIDKCDGVGECQEPIELEWWGDGVPTYTESNMTVPYFHASGNAGTNSSAAKIGQTHNVPRWHDVNGDGKPDYVLPAPNTNGQFPNAQMSFDMLLSQASGGYASQTWTTALGGNPKDFTWVDIDGDGRTDIVKLTSGGLSPSLHAALSTGSGFDNTSAYANVSLPVSSSSDTFVYRLGDMNGDGLIDIVRIAEYYTYLGGWTYALSSIKVRAYLNDGNGFASSSTSWGGTFHLGKYDLLDLTGDGLLDLLRDDRYVYANTGHELESLLRDFTAPPGGFDPVAYVDVDGDGLPDRRVMKWQSNGTWQGVWVCCEVQRNTGKQFLSVQSPISSKQPGYLIDDNTLLDYYFRLASNIDPETPTGATAPPVWSTTLHKAHSTDSTGANFDDTTITYNERMNFFHQWTDLNGDGLNDLTLAKTRYCHTYNVQYLHSGGYYINMKRWRNCEDDELKVLMADGAPLNLLKMVRESFGLETEFTYKPLTDTSVYTKGSSAVFPDYDIQDSTQVVSRLRQSNGIGGTATVEYQYEGLVRNVQGRGSLGFEKIIVNNLDTGIFTETEYSQTFPHTAKATQVSAYRTSDQRLLSRITTNYSTQSTAAANVVYSFVDSQVEQRYALEGAPGRLLSTTTTSNTDLDLFGNIGETEVLTVDHENALQHTSLTLRDFATNASPSVWRVGDMIAIEQKAWRNGVNEPAKDRMSTFTYDALTGYRLTETREPGGGVGVEMTETRAYDAVGNVVSTTQSGPGIVSRTSTTGFDGKLLFPVAVTNALGHVQSMTWDRRLGVMLSETDPNGVQTQKTFTPFGLPDTVSRAGGTLTEYFRFTCSDASCDAIDATTYVEVRETGAATKREYFDRLGRVVRTRTQAFDGQRVNVDTEYDTAGRVYRRSEPYFDGDTPQWNVPTYDILGREVTLTAVDATMSRTIAYDGFETAVTDAGNRVRNTRVNALGQIVRVIDPQGLVSEFDYDAMGNRTLVNNAVGTAHQSGVAYDHDRLGRLIEEDDPNRGLYSYTLDAFNNRLTEVSPKLAATAQSIVYQYDVLNRPISRTEPEGTTTWSYDDVTAGNLGLGKIHSESKTGYSKVYSYSPFDYGRLTGTTTTIGTESYTTVHSYDAQGRPLTEQYPDNTTTPGGFVVQYTYSPVGHLEAVESLQNNTVLYQLIETDAKGRVVEEWLGDGSTVTQAFQGASSRIASQQSMIGASTVQEFTYAYDATGNMLSRVDDLHGLTETFSYDTLDRLTSASLGGGAPVNYGFSPMGNLIEKSDVGTSHLYNLSQPHAVSGVVVGGSLPPPSFAYDANGNFDTLDSIPMIAWSSYDKPVSITTASVTYGFEYGPDRARYRKVHNGQITHYVGTGFEAINSSGVGFDTHRHYVRANGRVIMIREDANGAVTHRYAHTDHLGSITALTDETTGTVVARYSYDAWGLRRNPITWQPAAITSLEKRGYTGHEHLDDVGIIHMNGRLYSPSLGRMLSPDPVTQAPENAQNYNRYSYAFNNPLRFTDPSGHIAETVAPYVIDYAFNWFKDGLIGAIGGIGRCGPNCQATKMRTAWCNATNCLAPRDPIERLRANEDLAYVGGVGNGLSVTQAWMIAQSKAARGDNPDHLGTAKFIYGPGLEKFQEAFEKYSGVLQSILPSGEHSISVFIDPALAQSEECLSDKPTLCVVMSAPDSRTIYVNPEFLAANTLERIGSAIGHELVHIKHYLQGRLDRSVIETVNSSERAAYHWQSTNAKEFGFGLPFKEEMPFHINRFE